MGLWTQWVCGEVILLGLATVGRETGVNLPLEMAGEMGLGREITNFWSSLVRSHLVRLAYSLELRDVATVKTKVKVQGQVQRRQWQRADNVAGREKLLQLGSGAGKQQWAGLRWRPRTYDKPCCYRSLTLKELIVFEFGSGLVLKLDLWDPPFQFNAQRYAKWPRLSLE